MNLNEAISSVKPISIDSKNKARERWDSIAKPLNSLGTLETTVSKIAGILHNPDVDISKRCLVIMCADNGVVVQGVTQSDSIVTTIMSENFAKGTTTVCTMAKYIGVDVMPVDIGINHKVNIEGLINKNIMLGTKDITQGAAMSRLEAIEAIEVGINIAIHLKEQGYTLLATGEMGIGNTTTSSCIATVILEAPIEKVTGRGAGLNKEGLERKINVVEEAIRVNKPNKNDAIDVLAKVGGLDIAAMAGLFIGGAVAGVPVMIDGFISGISALIASEICPLSKEYMIASHVSAEPAGKMILDELGFLPIVTAGMCLGEGTGAMAALSVIDMAVDVYKKAVLFSQINIEDYVHFDEGELC